MRNSVGEGPAALTLVRTTEPPAIRPSDQHFQLVFGSEYKILFQGSNLFADQNEVIYASDELIIGMAFHVAQKLLFILHRSGIIYR